MKSPGISILSVALFLTQCACNGRVAGAPATAGTAGTRPSSTAGTAADSNIVGPSRLPDASVVGRDAQARASAQDTEAGPADAGNAATRNDSAPEAQLSIQPDAPQVGPGQSVKLHLYADGKELADVSWSASAGRIESDGTFTAPDSAGAVTITATATSVRGKATSTVVVAAVRGCGALPAAGTWERVSPAGADETNAVVVDPFDVATVYVGVTDQGIFQSPDCGASWKKLDSSMPGTGIANGQTISMIVDPQKKGVMYATSTSGERGLFKSVNGGVDWTQLFTANSEPAKSVQYNLMNSVGMDPTDSNHLIISTHADCLAPYGPVCVVESFDGGTSWKIVNVKLPGATQWVAGASAFILNRDTWLFGTYSAGLWLVEQSGAKWTNVTPEGASGTTIGKVLIRPFTRGPMGRFYLTGYEGVISSDDGKVWKLLPNSGGRAVGLAWSDDKLFTSDQWAPAFHSAEVSNLATWKMIPSPGGWANDVGAPYLIYDREHHVLYASAWKGGLWRMVVQ